MFRPRRYSRRRIWRGCLRSMAAFWGLSALLLCFCCSVLKVSPFPAGHPGSRENLDLATNYERRGELILQYRESAGVTSTTGLQRHNRALQFMDSKDSSLELNETSNSKSGESVQKTRNSEPKSLSAFTVKHESDNKNRLDVRTETPYPEQGGPSKFYPSQLTSKTLTKDKNISGPSPQEFHFVENTDDQLDILPSLRREKPSLEQREDNISSHHIQIKRLPKAIIIGAKKAGTRALLEFLRIHPNVEGTGPEPHFFDRNYDKGLEWYRELMPKTYGHQITIEKTPGYFVTREAPKRIFDMDPAIKLILVVRDPVTRAISDYCQAASKHPMRTFEEMALLDESLGLVNTSWGAIKIGVYAKHMEHWMRVFNLNQIHLVDGQKLIEEPARELAKVETFLGLPKFIVDSHFYLRGFKGTFPCLIREGKPHCLDEKTKGRDHPVVKASVLERLKDFYRPFNAKFYQMVGRKFEWS